MEIRRRLSLVFKFLISIGTNEKGSEENQPEYKEGGMRMLY